jgi:hypothetical protein
LHGCSGVKFSQGSFLDSSTLPRRYHFIDAFGVLHHLDNPLHGFVSLADRLEPGGFLRVMVYGRYARQEAESIRRAARILKIDDVQTLKRLFKRSGKHSSLRDYLDASWEAKTDSGIADLFLHPSVNTYRMEEFLELTEQSGLKPLLFTHTGALSNPDDEIERFRELDWQKKSITNIICYLGRDMKGGASLNSGTLLRLNPALEDAVSIFQLKTIAPENRLGRLNPPLDSNARKFLRRFRLPVIFNELDKRDKYEAKKFIDAMFLISSK